MIINKPLRNYYTLEKDFNWQNKKVKALGVWLSTDPETTIKLNFVEKIEKMRNCMGCWSVRRLSLIGKITVLKVARLDFFWGGYLPRLSFNYVGMS